MGTVIKVPRELKVGGLIYKVIYRPLLSKDEGVRGLINHRKELIQIEPENPLDQRSSTLYHEVIHLIDTVFALDMTEESTERLANGLFQVLSSSFGIDLDWSDIESE